MNTCYSPTPSRDPHIGHAWVAYMNWQAARRSGGEFVVLWDDISYANGRCEQSGWSLETGIARTREQLTWLGLAPDREGRWSDHYDAGREAAEMLGYKLPRTIGALPIMHDFIPAMREGLQPYGALYEPALMALWVVGEARERIEGYYTGMDFIGTAAFYHDVCRRLGIRPPLKSYLPCVRRERIPEKESKSKGAVSIDDLRLSGFKPWQIISTLRECDRTSRRDYMADLVIPEGILEDDRDALTFTQSPTTGKHLRGWLEYQGDIDQVHSCLTCYGPMNFEPQLRQYAKSVRATNMETQAAIFG